MSETTSLPTNVSTIVSDLETQDAIASQGWAGIPFNIFLNTGLFIVSIAAFTFVRNRANSERSKNETRIMKGWVQFIYADRSAHSELKQFEPYVECHVHDNRYPGILFTPAILETLNIDQEEIKDDQSIDRKEFFDAVEILNSDDEEEDFDRHERKAEYIHKYTETVEPDMRPPMRESKSWLYDIFRIQESDILLIKGRDAVQYLTFERYIMCYLLILTVLCLLVILPINLQGKEIESGGYFLRTTIWNIEPGSNYLWAHTSFSLVLYPIGIYLMRRFVVHINVEEADVCSRTLLIRRIPQWLRSKQMLMAFLKKRIPNVQIVALQLVYDINKLTSSLSTYNDIVNAKYYCEDYLIELGNRFEGRPYKCGKFGGIFCCCCCCSKVDGIEYYTKMQKEIEKQIQLEYEQSLANPSGAVFITFETVEMVKDVQYFTKSCRRNFFLDCIDVDQWVRYLCNGSTSISNDPGNVHSWILNEAPFPEDIVWSVISKEPRRIWIRRITGYIFLGIIFFFFSTPAILVQLAEGQFHQNNNFLRNSPMLAAYIEPLLLILVGNILPMFVYYAAVFLPHKTVSSRNHSVMVLTFLFLVLMIVILPSLGYTSTLTLVDRIFGHNGSIPLTEMITGTGSLFTNYVIQSALLSNSLELIRMTDVCLYFVNFIFFSSTIAEYESARKNIVYDFQFGLHYSKITLVVFIVNAYSLTCPLIAPFGILYMIIKYAVDKYNIYFVYEPGRIDIRMHSAAIIFFHISLMAMQLRLLSCLAIIEAVTPRSSIVALAFLIELFLFCIQLYNRYFYGLFSFRKTEKKYFQEWCACSYIPDELEEATTRGIVDLDTTSVREQSKAIKVKESQPKQATDNAVNQEVQPKSKQIKKPAVKRTFNSKKGKR